MNEEKKHSLPVSPEDFEHLKKIYRMLNTNDVFGSASIMIGAGFSRNADPQPNAPKMPLWHDLGQMWLSALPESQSKEPTELAGEYEAEFSRIDLVNSIEEVTPDKQYSPGNLHRCLLKLPWRDVFTTNYDTLLDRTAFELQQRRYTIINIPENIPGSIHPRLINLHGKLKNSNLIITDEDYRKYSNTHAPFVNLVRQAMLETTFVLVGFSGDDPNFKAWIGWVRDQLGPNMPPVYLVAVQKFSRGKSHLLRKLNIIPISLAYGIEESDHITDYDIRVRFEWLLSFFHQKSGIAYYTWPEEFSDQDECVIETPFARPAFEVSSPPKIRRDMDYHNKDDAEILINRWEFERVQYPGWLIAPKHVRDRLWGDLYQHIQKGIFNAAEQLDTVISIRLLYETLWRLDTSLVPLFDQWIPSVLGIWRQVCYIQESEKHSEILQLEVDSGLNRKWSLLGVFILQTLRRDGKIEKFREVEETLLKYSKHLGEIKPQVELESFVLSQQWPEYEKDPPANSPSLREWDPGDLYLEAMKASLMFDAGFAVPASELASSIINKLPRTLNNSALDFSLMSLEAWLMAFERYAHNLLSSRRGRFRDLLLRRHKYTSRLRVLRMYDCDPYEEIKNISLSLKEARGRPQSGEKFERGFFPDIGMRTVSYFAGGLSEAERAAWASILIPDKVPVSRKFADFDAAKLVFNENKALSLNILLNSSNLKQIEKWLTLEKAMMISRSIANDFLKLCIYKIHKLRSLENAEGKESTASDDLEVSILMGGRVSVRAARPIVFRLILLLYDLLGDYPLLIRRREMADTIGESLGICLRRLGRDDWQDFIILYSNQPLAPLNDNYMQDEVVSFEADLLVNPDYWRNIRPKKPLFSKFTRGIDVDLLIAFAKSGESTVRIRSIFRLIALRASNLLSDAAEKAFGDAIWGAQDADGLPRDTGLHDFAFLELPHPAETQVFDLIKNRLLNRAFPQLSFGVSDSRMTEFLSRLHAIGRQKERGATLFFDNEVVLLSERLNIWWENVNAGFENNSGLAHILTDGAQRRQLEGFIFAMVRWVFPEMLHYNQLPEGLVREIKNKCNENEMICFELDLILNSTPEQWNEYQEKLSFLGFSFNNEILKSVLRTIFLWFNVRNSGLNIKIPDVSESVLMVLPAQFVRAGDLALYYSLDYCEYLVRIHSDKLSDNFLRALYDGLAHIRTKIMDMGYEGESGDANSAWIPEGGDLKNYKAAVSLASSLCNYEWNKHGEIRTPSLKEWGRVMKKEINPYIREGWKIDFPVQWSSFR